jgi:hypothetical protein
MARPFLGRDRRTYRCAKSASEDCAIPAANLIADSRSGSTPQATTDSRVQG